jgi:hypothetical protein
MKQLFLLTAIISIIFTSCDKSKPYCDKPIPSSLDGKWRMIMVKENVSGITISKPAAVEGEVDIQFTTANAEGGTFIGKTPTNDIWQNDFFTGANQAIHIPHLAMTKVMETSWGTEFVANILNAETYTFETGGRLHINTTAKILTFRKL